VEGPTSRKHLAAALVSSVMLLALLVPSLAAGHIERASYWPLPGPDTSVNPPAGGAVPTPRSLSSVLISRPRGSHVCAATKRRGKKHHGRKKHARARCAAARHQASNKHEGKHLARPAGEMLAPGVRVVCQANSLALAQQSIAAAQMTGVSARPTEPAQKLDPAQARDLLELNQDLFKLCAYHEIQPAVTASSNHGRVVIMPGLYTEPTARKAPTHDPACAKYKLDGNGKAGETGAVSYAYQFHCSNDANLIAVLGRAPGTGTDPQPPLQDRHGIPNSGPCLRCNLQMEGSGASADDVIIDAGNVASGNHGPIGAVKDVGVRVDRADGFVLRNVTVRHAGEHDVYVLESNGYLLDHFKTFYGGEYGVLTFVEDHGLIQNCEAAGNGDSGLYPGAGGDTGVKRDRKIYPDFRYSQEIRFCDSHHNAGGYSGTDGNATHIDHNNFYDNALGFTTDVFDAPGHPGFPQGSDLLDNNNFYSNNFNPYVAGSDVKPTIPVPVGTGMWIAGGNSNVVRNNRFYDNWRRGAMLYAVPNEVICSPGVGQPVTGCDPSQFSTSYDNQFHDNVMGVAPDGSVQPNGQDFWWDGYPGNSGNCWFANSTASGRSLHNSPSSLPDCAGGTAPTSSIGTGSSNESELTGCFAAESGGGYDSTSCPWFTTPAKPSR